MQIYLHTFANTISHLQVQPLLAGVEAINDLLVLQFSRTNHQPCQIASEKLSHVQFTTFKKRGRENLDLFWSFLPFLSVAQECQLIHTGSHTCRLVFICLGVNLVIMVRHKEWSSSPCTWPSDSCGHPELTAPWQAFQKKPHTARNQTLMGWAVKPGPSCWGNTPSAQDTGQQPCSWEGSPLNQHHRFSLLPGQKGALYSETRVQESPAPLNVPSSLCRVKWAFKPRELIFRYLSSGW